MERDQALEGALGGLAVELVHLKERLGELRLNVEGFNVQLGLLRTTELHTLESGLRLELGQQAAEIKLLRYQMGRTTAVWSLISGGVSSAIVAAVMALLLRH